MLTRWRAEIGTGRGADMLRVRFWQFSTLTLLERASRKGLVVMKVVISLSHSTVMLKEGTILTKTLSMMMKLGWITKPSIAVACSDSIKDTIHCKALYNTLLWPNKP